jgi:hypothetical protein
VYRQIRYVYGSLQNILDRILPPHQYNDRQENKIFDKKQDFLCVWFVYDADSSMSTCVAANDRIMAELVAKDLEGSGSGLK